MTEIPTTDQLRHRIDSGATGEKVPFPDPAAAPLGTDAEASGNSPTLLERAMEARAQPKVSPVRKVHGSAVFLAAIGAVFIAIMFIGWTAIGGR